MRNPPTILVVEDEPTVRVLAGSIIQTQGYSTLSAATAKEALALLESEENSIDLLFTDIQLPDGPDAMDGLELARKAVELLPGLGVIYTSGGGQTDGMAALFVEGATFLAKPYTYEPLVHAVEEAFRRQPPLASQSARVANSSTARRAYRSTYRHQPS